LNCAAFSVFAASEILSSSFKSKKREKKKKKLKKKRRKVDMKWEMRERKSHSSWHIFPQHNPTYVSRYGVRT
jgi:hypothetical protein